MKQYITLLITLMLMLTGCGTEAGSDSSDTTPPVITLIGESEISLTQNATYTESGATATDDSDGSVSVTTTGSVDTAAVGVYTITYTATDSSGNSATATRTVNVLAASPENNLTTYKIVDTAQTLCYNSATGAAETCTGKGYDADYDGNQPSYTLSAGGGVVTDNVTGLMWTQSTDTDGDGVTTDIDDKMSQSEAVTYCSELSLEGYDDWRLPDIKTAYSLILFSGEDPSGYSGSDTSGLVPFIDPVFSRAFGDMANGERIIDGQYATTSLYVSTTMNGDATMFGVNFVDGRIKGYPSQIMEFYVQCVRGSTDYGVNDFTDNGDSTVSDAATGLLWEQNSSNSTDWDNAVEMCEASATGGHTDWRLPNAKELQSIVDYTRSPDTNASAALDPLFNATSFVNERGETDWGSYWSSTTHANSNGIGDSAAYLSFGRALGYMSPNILDVHGAGAQRSDNKLDESSGALLATVNSVSFYYKGPQGDIRRKDNKVRCVRDDNATSSSAAAGEGYTLFAPMQETTTYLVDANKTTVHTWDSSYRPGLSVYLLENGELLRTGNYVGKSNTFAGSTGTGGIIEILDAQSNVLWSKVLSTDAVLSHHDVEVLPNGNVLAVVWEAKSADEVAALGRASVDGITHVWGDAVYEICRNSAGNNCTDGEVVWKWSVWDHVVQETNSSIGSTYVADVSTAYDKVDLNYHRANYDEDWTHINSVDYNAATDQIMLSVHNFHEYWIIEHGDTTSGITYRAGNPDAYGMAGSQVLYGQHDAQWIEEALDGAGNILVFNNGRARADGDYSSVDEFCYDNAACSDGDLISSYSEGAGGTFYSDSISGAQRLSSGNTLVCEGVEGRLFEYNTNDEVVWELEYGTPIFRAYRYESDYAGLTAISL